MKDTVANFEMASWQFDQPSTGGQVQGTHSSNGQSTNSIDWGKIAGSATTLKVTMAGVMGLISIV